MEGTSMVCPYVSGVAALGLSYAVKERRHFKAAEFIELMKETANDQFYNFYDEKGKTVLLQSHNFGAPPTLMNLVERKGKNG